jgi:hypothetical protein
MRSVVVKLRIVVLARGPRLVRATFGLVSSSLGQCEGRLVSVGARSQLL